MDLSKRLKQYIRFVSNDLGAMEFYHGSPNSFADFKGNLIFLTKDINVAEQYARDSVLRAKRTSPTDNKPMLYTVKANLSNTFDLRKAEHRVIYDKMRAESKAKHPDDNDEWLPSIKSEGFIQNKGLPGFGHVRGIIDYMEKYGFDSMWVDEGSQGLSLAVINPAKKLKILSKQSL